MVDGLTSKLSTASPPRTRTTTRAIVREDIHSLLAASSGGFPFTMFTAGQPLSTALAHGLAARLRADDHNGDS